MSMTYINGGKIMTGGDYPGIAVVQYDDGLSSDIPNLPTQEEVAIQEQQVMAEVSAEIRAENDEQREVQDDDCPTSEQQTVEISSDTQQAEQKPRYSCDKKSDNVKYGSITIKRHKTSGKDDICLTAWHSDLEKCKAFADRNGLPLLAVWSNGKNCGKCVTFASAIASSTFRSFQERYKIVWCYTQVSDPKSGKYSDVQEWCRGEKIWGRKRNAELLTTFPFITFWWKKAGFDYWCTGDAIDNHKQGNTGGKNCVNFIKNKFNPVFKNRYNPNP